MKFLLKTALVIVIILCTVNMFVDGMIYLYPREFTGGPKFAANWLGTTASFFMYFVIEKGTVFTLGCAWAALYFLDRLRRTSK